MAGNNGYVHLHVHSEFSQLEGSAKINDLIDEAKKQNAKALALTDTGNLFGSFKFFKACEEANIKAIIGCEFYIYDNSHNKYNRIVLLAKDETGYKNLCKLSNPSIDDVSYTANNKMESNRIFMFKYKVVSKIKKHLCDSNICSNFKIDLDTLKNHSKGLIALSPILPQCALGALSLEEYDNAKKYALKLKSIFDEGDFYIELQDHNLEEQKLLNPNLIKIANEIGVKCVATNNIYYAKKSDSKYHDIYMSIKTHKKLTDKDRKQLPNDEFYLKTKEEMDEIFNYHLEATSTPNEIAEKCKFKFDCNTTRFPKYQCPNNLNAGEYLKKITKKGLEKRYGKLTKEIQQRAKEELDIITNLGITDCILIISDVVDWAKNNGIPVGPGRGPSASSIVLYALGVVDVDPLKYGLIFERFINKNTIKFPSFDIDVCAQRLPEVQNYMVQKYGKNHISKTIKFKYMGKLEALKKTASVFDYRDLGKLLRLLPKDTPGCKNPSLNQILNPNSTYYIKEIDDLYNENPTLRLIISVAAKLEGSYCSSICSSIKTMIDNQPVTEILPTSENSKRICTQYDDEDLSMLGFFGINFLPLDTLTEVKLVHNITLATKGIDLNFDDNNYSNLEVYKLISNGDTEGVFQLEEPHFQKFMKTIEPSCFEELIAAFALHYQCLSQPDSTITKYLEGRANPSKIKYLDNKLIDILKPTRGMILYQEQVMMIVHKIAGYDMVRANNFRRTMSFFNLKEIEKEREIFINGLKDEKGNFVLNDKGLPEVLGCIANGIDKKIAEEIFTQLKKLTPYTFTKAHATAYAKLTYITAYYKSHYPLEFMTAVLNNRSNNSRIRKYLPYLIKMGFNLTCS